MGNALVRELEGWVRQISQSYFKVMRAPVCDCGQGSLQGPGEGSGVRGVKESSSGCRGLSLVIVMVTGSECRKRLD